MAQQERAAILPDTPAVPVTADKNKAAHAPGVPASVSPPGVAPVTGAPETAYQPVAPTLKTSPVAEAPSSFALEAGTALPLGATAPANESAGTARSETTPQAAADTTSVVSVAPEVAAPRAHDRRDTLRTRTAVAPEPAASRTERPGGNARIRIDDAPTQVDQAAADADNAKLLANTFAAFADEGAVGADLTSPVAQVTPASNLAPSASAESATPAELTQPLPPSTSLPEFPVRQSGQEAAAEPLPTSVPLLDADAPAVDVGVANSPSTTATPVPPARNGALTETQDLSVPTIATSAAAPASATEASAASLPRVEAPATTQSDPDTQGFHATAVPEAEAAPALTVAATAGEPFTPQKAAAGEGKAATADTVDTSATTSASDGIGGNGSGTGEIITAADEGPEGEPRILSYAEFRAAIPAHHTDDDIRNAVARARHFAPEDFTTGSTGPHTSTWKRYPLTRVGESQVIDQTKAHIAVLPNDIYVRTQEDFRRVLTEVYNATGGNPDDIEKIIEHEGQHIAFVKEAAASLGERDIDTFYRVRIVKQVSHPDDDTFQWGIDPEIMTPRVATNLELLAQLGYPVEPSPDDMGKLHAAGIESIADLGQRIISYNRKYGTAIPLPLSYNAPSGRAGEIADSLGWHSRRLRRALMAAIKREGTVSEQPSSQQAEEHTDEVIEGRVVMNEQDSPGGDESGTDAHEQSKRRSQSKIRIRKSARRKLGTPRTNEVLYATLVQQEFGIDNPSTLVIYGGHEKITTGGSRAPFRRRISVNAVAAEYNSRKAEQEGENRRDKILEKVLPHMPEWLATFVTLNLRGQHKNDLARVIVHELQHDEDIRHHPVRTSLEWLLRPTLTLGGLFGGAYLERYVPFFSTLPEITAVLGLMIDHATNPSELRAKRAERNEELVAKFSEVVVFPQRDQDTTGTPESNTLQERLKRFAHDFWRKKDIGTIERHANGEDSSDV